MLGPSGLCLVGLILHSKSFGDSGASQTIRLLGCSPSAFFLLQARGVRASGLGFQVWGLVLEHTPGPRGLLRILGVPDVAAAPAPRPWSLNPDPLNKGC